jgi:hypothetical protein
VGAGVLGRYPLSSPLTQMKPSATPATPEPTDLKEGHRGQSAIFQAEVEDLERELRAVRKKERWHFVWALTGVSPAALIPAMGLVLRGNFGLVVPFVLLVTISQFYLGVKAAGKAARLKKALRDLREAEQSASQ